MVQSSSRDHTKELVRELAKVGIRPEVQKTNGMHVRISWECNGQRDSIVTSSTPSDYRATLNARARIRRKLRASGAYELREATSKLERALGLVVEPEPEPAHERIERLERDVEALLDMLADHISAHGMMNGLPRSGRTSAPPQQRRSEQPVAAPSAMSRRADAPAVSAPAEPLKRQGEKRGKGMPTPSEQAVLDALDHRMWSKISDIAQRLGKTYAATSVHLSNMKTRNLVVNKVGVGWRRPKAGETVDHPRA